MIRIGVLIALLFAVTPAYADDPNRWQGWTTPKDGQDNGLDVSMQSGSHAACGKKGWIQLQPRFRNRYQDHIAGKLKIDYEGVNGASSALAEFDLQVGETKIIGAAQFCHDSRKSLAFSIAELRFPERDAEQARMAAQKEAAEKAAAAEATARKAAAAKAAAETAAAEAAQREQVKQEAERMAKSGEVARARAAEERESAERASAARSAEQRQRQAAGEQYRAARAREAQLETGRKLAPDDLTTEKFRRGEVSVAAPLGFQSVTYTSDTEGRFAIGLRAELRLFSWVRKTNARGQPPAGNGFELAVAAGIARTVALGSQSSDSTTNLANGHLRARYWHGVLGVGVFGEWNRYAHSPAGGMATTYNLFALGPELAVGIVASRAIALEASVRAGPVAAGQGLELDSSNDLFVGASVVVELNTLYAGAFATRYVTSGALETSWNAMGMIGMRLPF